MSTLAAADGHVVSFHYTLRDDDGDVLDSSEGDEPLDYLHGEGGIVPGLEAALAGKKAGDTFEVTVPPAEGYGEVEGPGPRAIPRSAFPEAMELEEGLQLFIAAEGAGEEEEPTPVWVVELDDDQVMLDTNHPLAGQNLHFQIEVVDVREATAEEKEHGHPHGPDGHHHH
jgi:FKBP-type peptidyl-prolyl cis-trans isomerase SlyD